MKFYIFFIFSFQDFERQAHGSLEFFLARLMQRPTKYPLLLKAVYDKTPIVSYLSLRKNEEEEEGEREGEILFINFFYFRITLKENPWEKP